MKIWPGVNTLLKVYENLIKRTIDFGTKKQKY